MLRAAALLALALLPAAAAVAFVIANGMAGEIPLAERRSSYADMSAATRAMQDDDMANPASLVLLDGEALWNARDNEARKSCADCHGEPAAGMRGVAARYPAFDAARGRALDLAGRINLCRSERQHALPLAHESRGLVALTLLVAWQSRGMPIAPDERALAGEIDAGRADFMRRQGQLNLSCAHCHDDNWNHRLAGSAIGQGHPTGYPLFRLEWQEVGSLQRRLRNCMFGMRAEPYAYGAPEMVALEAFLMWRARGMAVETPAVRP